MSFLFSPMIEQVKRDIIKVLESARTAIKEKRFGILHPISDHIIHSISIFQDKAIFDAAVAIYALSKIYGKERHIRHKKIKKFTREILDLLRDGIRALKQDNEREYRRALKQILTKIHRLDRQINVYIEDVLEFARIKKGSRIYEHGISLGQAAAAARVSKWELMPTAGETHTHETFIEPIERRRLKLVKKLFEIK